MPDTIKIEAVAGSIPVDLPRIGSDVNSPEFTVDSSNPRYNNAAELVGKCAKFIDDKIGVVGSNYSRVLFVYRSVAPGGISRRVAGFSAKPISIKYKSIDPALLGNDDDLKRLSGLVPAQTKLGKGGVSNEEIDPGLKQYRVVKTVAAGNTKSYLYCDDNSRTLKFIEVTATKPAGKTEVTFLGDSNNPYLADWDLVVVGVRADKSKRKNPIFEIAVADGNILPNWLLVCLKDSNTVQENVTQHGPESLYCGNKIDMDTEQFLIVEGRAGDVVNKGVRPFTALKAALEEFETNGYLLYQFKEFFDGTGERKPASYPDAVSTFNSGLK